jgi:pumilio family protein 6
MAGIKRKSEASAPTDIKSKIKKSKVEKSSSKHSTKHDVTHRPKTAKKPKKQDDSDDLMESDTSEVENGYHGFSANKEAAANSEDDDSEGDAKADSTEDSEPKKEKRSKLKPQEEYKASGLAAMSGTLDTFPYPPCTDISNIRDSEFFSRSPC